MKQKQTRKVFSCEFKLSVIQWFHSNGKNVLQTSNYFKINRKQVPAWSKAEEKIWKQKYKSLLLAGKHISHKRNKCWCNYSRSIGNKVKSWKNGGFYRKREKSWVKSTRVMTTSTGSLMVYANGKIRRPEVSCEFVKRTNPWHVSTDIANMDQTSLPFVLDDDRTYDAKCAAEIWCTLRSLIFASSNFREIKKIGFREHLFSRIERFQKFREHKFSRIGKWLKICGHLFYIIYCCMPVYYCNACIIL